MFSFRFSVSRILLDWRCKEDAYHQFLHDWRFQNRSIRSIQLITPEDRHPQNGTKVMPKLSKKRARQSSPNKEGGTEISLGPVERWMGIPKPWAACEWPLHFLTTVELDEATIPNERNGSQYQMASFSVGKDYE